MADPEMPRGPRRHPVVIDFHAHIANEEVNAATYGLSVLGRLRAAGEGTAIHAMPAEHWKRMTDLPTRLADMDAMGVDIQVISPNILHNCTYALPAEEAYRVERIGNDHIAETVAQQARPPRRPRLGAAAIDRAGDQGDGARDRRARPQGPRHRLARQRDRSWRRKPAAVLAARGSARRADLHPSRRQSRSAAAQALDADLARPAAGGGLRAMLADLRRRNGRMSEAQDRLRARRRLHPLLLRPLRLDVLARHHQAHQVGFLDLSARLPLRERGVRSRGAGAAVAEGEVEPDHARHRLSVRRMEAGGADPEREAGFPRPRAKQCWAPMRRSFWGSACSLG